MTERFDANKNGSLEGFVQIGKKYPIRMGEIGEQILTMQYLFKPASIQRQSTGNFVSSGQPGSSEVMVDVEGSNGAKEVFKGTKRKAGITEHEYVMTLSTEGFQIHKVEEHILNLRVQREEDSAKLKESSTKESILMLESRKLPKFLQKAQPKKKLVAGKDSANGILESNVPSCDHQDPNVEKTVEENV